MSVVDNTLRGKTTGVNRWYGVYMFEGRTTEQRRKIVAGITQAMVDGAGTDAKEVHVLIHDVAISDWSNAGVLY